MLNNKRAQVVLDCTYTDNNNKFLPNYCRKNTLKLINYRKRYLFKIFF